MKFAPEYVTYVLNENFEDAKALLLVAADGDQLRAPRDARRAGDRLADGRARAARGARRRLAGRDSRASRTTAPTRICSSTSSAWSIAGLRRRRRRPAAHRAQPQRHRHDDVPDAAARVHPRAAGARRFDLRRSLLDLADRHRDTIFAVHTHTQRAQPTTVAHYLLAVVEQLERDAARLKARVRAHEPQPARRLRDHRHRVSDRSPADLGPARLLRADRQHLRQHRDGRLPAREHVGDAACCSSGLGRFVQDLLLWCTVGVRLPAARRRLRAGQQHHAAEAQSGRARARARHRQQGARPGAGDRHSPSTTRRSATSSTPRTICSRWCSRCSATRRAR